MSIIKLEIGGWTADSGVTSTNLQKTYFIILLFTFNVLSARPILCTSSKLASEIDGRAGLRSIFSFFKPPPADRPWKSSLVQVHCCITA